MGDRIDIKDSVIMGDVKIENTGNLPISCNCCNKGGYFVNYLCDNCQQRYCDDCASFIPDKHTSQCISCAIDYVKQIADYVFPLFQIFTTTDVHDLLEKKLGQYQPVSMGYKPPAPSPPGFAPLPPEQFPPHLQLLHERVESPYWQNYRQETAFAKDMIELLKLIQAEPLYYIQIYKNLIEIFGNYSLTEIKSVYDADCTWDYKMKAYFSSENKEYILKEGLNDFLRLRDNWKKEEAEAEAEWKARRKSEFWGELIEHLFTIALIFGMFIWIYNY